MSRWYPYWAMNRERRQSTSTNARTSDWLVRLGELAAVEQRFERISTKIRKSTNGSTVTTGLAEMHTDDSLETLLERADAAMMTARSGPASPNAAR
jgi:hypothetical protein